METRDTTAGVLVKDNLYLVAKRKKGGPLSGKWEFIGGKNRWGEKIEETLEREWMEEVGLKIRVGKYLTSTTFDNNNIHYTLHAFLVHALSDVTELTLSVHDDVRWVTKEELMSLPFGPSDSVIRDFVLASS